MERWEAEAEPKEVERKAMKIESKIFIEVFGKVIPVEGEDELRRLYDAIGQSLNSSNKPPAVPPVNPRPGDSHSEGSVAPTGAATDRRWGQVPPIGERVEDKIERVLTRAGKGLTADEILHDLVETEAFKTTSKRPTNFIAHTMYPRKDKFARKDGSWVLTQWLTKPESLNGTHSQDGVLIDFEIENPASVESTEPGFPQT